MSITDLASTSTIVQLSLGSGCSVGFFLKQQLQHSLKKKIAQQNFVKVRKMVDWQRTPNVQLLALQIF